jgi:hypothetical protein
VAFVLAQRRALATQRKDDGPSDDVEGLELDSRDHTSDEGDTVMGDPESEESDSNADHRDSDADDEDSHCDSDADDEDSHRDSDADDEDSHRDSDVDNEDSHSDSDADDEDSDDDPYDSDENLRDDPPPSEDDEYDLPGLYSKNEENYWEDHYEEEYCTDDFDSDGNLRPRPIDREVVFNTDESRPSSPPPPGTLYRFKMGGHWYTKGDTPPPGHRIPKKWMKERVDISSSEVSFCWDSDPESGSARHRVTRKSVDLLSQWEVADDIKKGVDPNHEKCKCPL